MDSIPVFSQMKSLVQVIAGDSEGARKTQENFRDTAPVVSQVTSLVQEIEGDSAGALETQKKFVKAMDDISDGLPIIGHIKGFVHYAEGDIEGGNKLMKSASGGLISGIAGSVGTLVGGPVGGVTATVLSSELYNGVVTAIDTSTKGTDKDGSPRYYGTWKTYDRIRKGKADAGEIFDSVSSVPIEILGKVVGKASRVVGNTVKRVKPGIKLNKNIEPKVSVEKLTRCRRGAEHNLTPGEFEFTTNNKSLPGSMGEVLEKDWQSLSVPETISSVVSIFIILRLILWNDRHGRAYSSELCSMTSPNVDIEQCQVMLMKTLRKMEHHLSDRKEYPSVITYPNKHSFQVTNSSEVMINTVATLYGILTSTRNDGQTGNNWRRQLCMYKTSSNYRYCENKLSSELQQLNQKMHHVRESRIRHIRSSCVIPAKTRNVQF